MLRVCSCLRYADNSFWSIDHMSGKLTKLMNTPYVPFDEVAVDPVCFLLVHSLKPVSDGPLACLLWPHLQEGLCLR